MSGLANDSSQTSSDHHGIVVPIVVVVIIILIGISSHVCSRVFCVIEHHPCDHHPSQGRGSSHNVQLAEEGGIESEASRRQGNRDTSRSCCSICLVDYRKDDELRSLPNCNHLFHRECIDQWLRLHPTCPICRKSPTPTPESMPPALTAAAPLRSATRAT